MNATNAHFNLNMANANNLNYHLIGSNLGPTVNMAQHFSSIFKPISPSSSTKDETLDPQTLRGGLPLWLGTQQQLPQAHGGYYSNIPPLQDPNIHYLSSTTIVNSLNSQNTPLTIQCSNPNPDNNYQLNWVFGSKTNNINGEELGVVTNNTSASTSSVTTSSIPCLYSTQHPQTSSSNSSHIMSATALLQKAAQMGATSTTTNSPNDPFFLGNFGLMKRNIGNNVDHQAGSLFGTSNSTTTNLGSDVDVDVEGGSSVDDIDLSTMTMFNPAAKRQRTLPSDGHQDGGQTRDFLGVGTQPICHPPSASINGWI